MARVKEIPSNVIAVVTVIFGACSMLGIVVLGLGGYQLILQGTLIALFAVFVVITLRINRGTNRLDSNE